MANPALGTKRHCQSCDEHYYDLNKSPINCPHCQTVFDPEVLLKSRKTKPMAAAPKKVEAAAEAAVDDNLDVDIEDENANDSANEDILDDDADLAVIAPASDSDDDIVSTDEAIEDELDIPEETEE